MGSLLQLSDVADLIPRHDAQFFKQRVADLIERRSLSFPGAQPVSFSRRHFRDLQDTDYWLCEKTDGIRCLLYLTTFSDGSTQQEAHMLIDRKNDYYNIDNEHFHFPLPDAPEASYHTETLLDGELVLDKLPGGGEQKTFMVFDCLAVDGKSLLQRTLDKRLGYFVESVLKPYHKLLARYPEEKELQPFVIVAKKMEKAYGVMMMLKDVLPKLPHGSDGLIFTCRTSPYTPGTDQKIIKWKPPHENTIDFRLHLGDFPSVTEDGQTFLDYDACPSMDLLVFHGSDRSEFYAKLHVTESEWESMKGMQQILDGRIIECHKDEHGRWRYKKEPNGEPRFRDDKTEANHISTVESVLESIEDASVAFVPHNDPWRLCNDLLRLQQVQADHTDRLLRLERRQDDDARMKSVWGATSPFPSVLSGTPQHAPIHLKDFDDEPVNLIGGLHLDPDEEPRRMGATSRANSVRFDESANQGHWAHASRSSIDFLPRSASSLGGLGMTERTSSHKSDGRASSVHSVRSAASGRASSINLDTGYASPLDTPAIAPGVMILGPVPAIVRCWLNTNFKHDALLYAAVSTASYKSQIDERLVRQLGLEDCIVGKAAGGKLLSLAVYFAEAIPHPNLTRSSSPAPQVPSVTIDFNIVDLAQDDIQSRAIQVVIGSDVLRSHNADILLSSNSMTIFDDDQCKLSIPLVRPENEATFNSLSISSSSQASTRQVMTQEEHAQLNGLGQTNPSSPSNEMTYVTESAPMPTDESVQRPVEQLLLDESAGRSKQQPFGSKLVRLENKDSAISVQTQTPDPPASSPSIWSNWRRETSSQNTGADAGGAASKIKDSGYQRRDAGIKVLRPTRTISLPLFISTELPFSGGSPIVKTASSKKQKVAHSAADSPRHAYHHSAHDPDRQPSSPHSSSSPSPSSNTAAHTPSSPPRYIPPHLHVDSRGSSPSDAYAQLNLTEDMSHPNGHRDMDSPNPPQRPASPAKRSAATMEGIESSQHDSAQPNVPTDDPPPYDAHQEDALASTIPSVEEQVAHIQSLLNTPVEDGSTGFIVASKWFNRVVAKTADANQKNFDSDMLEGEVGKIDNSSLVAPGAFDNPLAFVGKPDLAFIPLLASVERAADYEIFTEEAWNQVVTWYGITEGHKPIVRLAHNSAPEGSTSSHIVYELSPPIFTIRKVPAHSQPAQADIAAASLVASRTERFQTFLAHAKEAAGIPMQRKVKIFRQLDPTKVSGDMPTLAQPGIPSPPTSRASSPSLTTSSKLVIDAATFAKWIDGTNFEPTDGQDHTANEKYNGRMTLETLGFVAEQTLVLEEQQRGAAAADFASDTAKKQKKTSSQLSQTTNTSRQSSPAPTAQVTRGRTRKDGKTRGAIGLVNLGNTCYMNSALQCISRVEELAVYFLHQKHKPEINADNPLGYNGRIANAYANLLAGLYNDTTASAFRPNGFKGALSMAQPMFSGYGQQDSQEFLSFLVDALHEDLNRIQKKPYIENPDSDDKTVHDPAAIRQLGDTYRANHHARNDSIAMDLFNGFYKNTMLPIENTWQGKIMFMPVTGYPSAFEIDVEKNISIKALKDIFVTKIGRGLTRERLILAEMFSHRFYKIAFDSQTLSELDFSPNDVLCMYELAEVPTNAAFMPKKQTSYRSFYNDSSDDALPGMDSPLAETMAIPVFHSKLDKRSSNLALNPTLVVVTREEAKSYDAILKRVLTSIAPMTTKRLPEDVLSKEDGDVASEDIRSDQDADVDVSMRDGSQTPAKQQSDALQSGDFISPELRNMFELKYVQSSGDMFMTGTNSIGNGLPMQDRVRNVDRRRGSTASSTSNTSSRSKDSGYDGQGRSSPSSDADPMIESFKVNGQSTFSGDVQSDEESGMASLEQLSAKDTRRPVDESTDDDEFYIRLGEGIVIEWNEDAFEFLFGGSNGNGQFTFNEKDVPVVDDNELQVRRTKRMQRKKNGITLDDCFTETGKTEVLSEDNAWYCSRCKELRRASKTLELWTVPDILVVHLKRFSGERFRRDKVDVLVDFPIEGLDLTKRIGCKEEGKEYVYDLFAVDNHYGGLGGGHYTAYAKNFYDSNWYDYNDSSVSRQNAEGVVSTAAYLLFYRRRSPTPLGPPYLQELVLKSRNPDEASETEDESGEGQRLGDHSSASFRLPGSLNVGAVGAGAASTGTPQQGANVDGSGRGVSQEVRLMSNVDDDEGISLNDDLYNSNNNMTAAQLANETSWGFENLGEDDNTTSVNTPVDTASDRPEIGSDLEDRFMDTEHEDDDERDQQGTFDDESLPPLIDDDENMDTEDQEHLSGPASSVHQDE
ncbi:cysteine proteinase [Aureobasidium subglaciale]|nr:cysteine proteinase [Aureobasidium subglaciale]KAI5217129.1 cysteine proteinase [Aureobasidium subglaciale]KAI5223378.1 cysteine proteinase [Aureobasidium subglaciale]KAI5254948.1 cysteine proteinase [Aureobasidium subglaciale]